jgi:hypothetical protein
MYVMEKRCIIFMKNKEYSKIKVKKKYNIKEIRGMKNEN